MRASVNVAGASLPTGAPRAVEYTSDLLASRGGADDRIRGKIGGEGAEGRIYVEGHEKEEGSTAGSGNEGQCRCRVEIEPLTACTPRRSAPRSAEPEFQQLATSLLLLLKAVVLALRILTLLAAARVKQELRAATAHHPVAAASGCCPSFLLILYRDGP